jgi:predicted GNAT superfamily acetyltransferase
VNGRPEVQIRDYVPADEAWVFAANQANVPEVGPMDAAKFAWYVANAPYLVVAEVDGERAGFLFGFTEGSDYASPNYRWFAARYPAFVYVDRVVVDERHRGLGIGRRLYDHFVAWSAGRHPVLCAEVNTRPRNDASLAFHDRYGFVEVGRQEPYGDGPHQEIEVAMLARELPPD